MKIAAMARGWESKGVESQIEDRQQARRMSSAERDDTELRERDLKRASLETSRRRVQRELDSAHSETHRVALRNALAYLDEELAKLIR